MPRKDAYHDIVKAALVKDGWQITEDPFLIDFRGTLLFADLGAEKATGFRRRRRRIGIEVKVLMNLAASLSLNARSANMSSIAA